MHPLSSPYFYPEPHCQSFSLYKANKINHGNNWIIFRYFFSNSLKAPNFFKAIVKWYGLPWWLSGKEFACQWRHGFDPWVKKIPWRRRRQASLVFLPEKSHGKRSLVGYSPWGCKESDTTERLSMHRRFANLMNAVLEQRWKRSHSMCSW